MNNYLIPANSKKSQLILNTFRPIDIVIGLTGIVTSLILWFLPGDGVLWLALKLIPAAVSMTLVIPIPYYHNVLVFLREVYMHYVSQRTYSWRGWCATYGFEETNKN